MQYHTSIIMAVLCALGNLAVLLGHPSSASAGATIIGTVTYYGQPQEESYPTSKNPEKDYCATLVSKKPALFRNDGELRVVQTLQVRPDGALKDAIVAVQDIVDQTFVTTYPGTEVRIEECTFLPYTTAVVDKRNFHVVNLDPADHAVAQTISHNPHGTEVIGLASRTLFNIALAVKGAEINKTISLRQVQHGSAVRLVCDQHAYMQAWFLPVTNAYFGTTGSEGTFEIKNVPQGRHVLKAWHPKAGMMDVDVVVPESGQVRVNIEIPKK